MKKIVLCLVMLVLLAGGVLRYLFREPVLEETKYEKKLQTAVEIFEENNKPAAVKPDWVVNLEKQRELALLQRVVIEAEIEKLGDHPWAGHYATGCGLSGSDVIVAPEAGFVFLDWADIGSFWYRGQCTYENGVIKLAYDPTGEEEEPKFVPRELVYVRWGERSYLLSDDLVGSLKNFCEQIVLGYEPRYGDPGILFLIREGDCEKPVEGLPEFPEGYEKYAEMLRKHTIDAEILAVGEVGIKPEEPGYGEQYRMAVTIDKGEDAGVLPDTEYVSGNLTAYTTLRFSEVGPTQSVGIIEFPRKYSNEKIVDGKSTLVVPGKRVLMAEKRHRKAHHAPQSKIEEAPQEQQPGT